jgi:hypothetical protein
LRKCRKNWESQSVGENEKSCLPSSKPIIFRTNFEKEIFLKTATNRKRHHNIIEIGNTVHDLDLWYYSLQVHFTKKTQYRK